MTCCGATRRDDALAPRIARAVVIAIGFSGLLLAAGSAASQDLEPRAYTAAPVGLSFLLVAAGHSTGAVLVDPSLPVEDVSARLNSLSVGGGTTVDFFSRTALIVALFPYVRADASGRVAETSSSVSRSGLADPRFKLSVNLLGGRALTAKEFVRAERPTILGVSLTAASPLGQYYPARLINLGSNRWAFKPEMGLSHQAGRWTIDGYAGVWLFTANNEFYTGASVRTQDPIVALQAHVSYTLKPRAWLAFDATWYSGGTTTIDGVSKADLQRNSRVGATVSFPLPRQQSLKIAGSAGTSTRVGAAFKTLLIAWQLSWVN
jgi:hypothetical protein